MIDWKAVDVLMKEFEALSQEKRGLLKAMKQGNRDAMDRIIQVDKRLNEIDKLTASMTREPMTQEEIDSHE